jgi:hypothetical protein
VLAGRFTEPVSLERAAEPALAGGEP